MRVAAAALNHIDLWLRQGLPRCRSRFRTSRAATSAASSRRSAPGVKPCRRWPTAIASCVNPGLSCGRCAACLAGRDNFCPDYQMMGEQTSGGQAEYVVVPAANLVPAPRARVAARRRAARGAADAVHHRLADAGRPRARSSRARRCWSWPPARASARRRCRSPSSTARGSSPPPRPTRSWPRRARSGADETINHATADLVAEVKRLTGRRGADIVFEHVGARDLPQVDPRLRQGRAHRHLRRDGRATSRC